MNKLSEENEALLVRELGEFWPRMFAWAGNDMREAINRLLNAARSEALSSPGAGREEVETLLVEHVRKINRVVAAGMHEGGAIREAADAILSLLSSPGGQGNTEAQGCGTDGAVSCRGCQPESPASAAEAVSPWRPIETASEHDVAYKALGIALAALQHIQGMEPITQEITLPTVMAQHAVDALKEIEALGATSCPNPCGECRGVVRAGKCGVCGWEPVP